MLVTQGIGTSFRRMLQRSVAPDKTSFNLLLAARTKKGDAPKSLECVQQMREMTIAADRIAFNSVEQAISRCGDFAGA